MTDNARFTPTMAGELLRQLRPLDLALALRVYRGSALAERPALEELVSAEARLFWLAALTSHTSSQSHSGLRLDHTPLESLVQPPEILQWEQPLSLIDLLGTGDSLLEQFPGQVILSTETAANPDAPFVFRREASLIYFTRWYTLEAELGRVLRERLNSPPRALPKQFAPIFQRFFTPEDMRHNPWQAVACASALAHDLAVITGGPGTGKTTTITRLIGLLLSLPETQRPHTIQMVAPTGKAAERMRESFGHNFEALQRQLPLDHAEALSAHGKQTLATPATIHAFLGSRGLAGFTHDTGNPVDCDLLIVDEATMVDLDLFAALFRALPRSCRLVLLGDRNQLTAVETGNVFSDLTSTGPDRTGALNRFSPTFQQLFENLSGLPIPAKAGDTPICRDCVTELEQSYRFSGTSPVGQLARLLMEKDRLPQADELPIEIITLDEDWQQQARRTVEDYAHALRAKMEPATLLGILNASRILCAVRRGEAGVEYVNQLLSTHVLGSGGVAGFPQHGLPFLILQNDRALGLSNGDHGVFLIDKNGLLSAYLPTSAATEEPRKLDPFALPDWEPAFAMTIHKSQGSEYESVLVILPETQRPFISWELVYTAITRAKQEVTLVLPKKILGQHLPRTRRVSGLIHELDAHSFASR